MSFSVYLQLNDRLGLARDLRFVGYISRATNYFFPLFAFFFRFFFSSLYMGIGKISSSFTPFQRSAFTPWPSSLGSPSELDG